MWVNMNRIYNKNFKISMNDSMGDVFEPKVKLLHQYDYGTTTTVALRSGKVFELKLKKN